MIRARPASRDTARDAEPERSDRLLAFAAAIAAAVCMLGALSEGVRVVSLSSRPYDVDQFRDIAAAQAIADGRGLLDPFYAGETIWYNPLVPVVVAVIGQLSGGDIPESFVRSGPFLNLLAVVAFFWATTMYRGIWPALIALASLLFFPPHADPVWSTPSYSPWLFPATFSLALFYVGLALVFVAIRRQTFGWWLFCGVWLGLTLLSHTSPAVILSACVIGAVADPVSRVNGPLRRTRLLLVIFGVAACVAAPLLWSIVGRYHLNVQNPAPNKWVWDALDASRVRPLLATWLTIWSIPVVVGLISLVRGAWFAPRHRVLLWWALSATILFLYGWLEQTVDGRRLPPLIPQYHSYLYLRALGHLLLGIGVWQIATTIARAALRSPSSRRAAAAVLALAFVTIATIANLDDYRRRPGFRLHRSESQHASWVDRQADIRGRLRTQVPPDTIVLASAWDSLTIVAASGRRVVSVPREFSNPFVNFDDREWAQRRMMDTLKNGDFETFLRYARVNGVGAVLLRDADASRVDALGILPKGLTELSRQGGIVLYRMHDPTR